AMGIPTKKANREGLKATGQIVNMLADQIMPDTLKMRDEIEVIGREVRQVMNKVLTLGKGDIALGAVRAFEAGVIDVPFAPSIHNRGKLMPIRDNLGAIRVFQPGNVPLDKGVLDFHNEQVATRASEEGRKPCFQMVVDDIYAISKGRLVGRPRGKR
ncbi:MAG: hypothetical protein KAJ45_07680, partial [Desulfobulbaceae bacterium]|nr:hypothetical protein [Desulfobulbaceae bacterium]